MKYPFISLGLLGLLVACSSEETPSTAVKTKGIWADMQLVGDGERTRITVELNVGGSNGTNVVLEQGDNLVASSGNKSKTMSKDTDFFDVDYQAYFATSVSNALFKISFNRPNGTSAPDSSVELPDVFSIYAPDTAVTYSKNQSLQLSWDGLSSDKLMHIYLSASCTNNTGGLAASVHQFSTPDDGNHTLELGKYELFSDTQLNVQKDCELDITLTRSQAGSIDAAYQSGSQIVASQRRTLENIKIDI